MALNTEEAVKQVSFIIAEEVPNATAEWCEIVARHVVLKLAYMGVNFVKEAVDVPLEKKAGDDQADRIQ